MSMPCATSPAAAAAAAPFESPPKSTRSPGKPARRSALPAPGRLRRRASVAKQPPPLPPPPEEEEEKEESSFLWSRSLLLLDKRRAPLPARASCCFSWPEVCPSPELPLVGGRDAPGRATVRAPSSPARCLARPACRGCAVADAGPPAAPRFFAASPLLLLLLPSWPLLAPCCVRKPTSGRRQINLRSNTVEMYWRTFERYG